MGPCKRCAVEPAHAPASNEQFRHADVKSVLQNGMHNGATALAGDVASGGPETRVDLSAASASADASAGHFVTAAARSAAADAVVSTSRLRGAAEDVALQRGMATLTIAAPRRSRKTLEDPPACSEQGDLKLRFFPCCLEGLAGMHDHPVVQHEEYLLVSWIAPNGSTGVITTLASSLGGYPYVPSLVDPSTGSTIAGAPLVPACAAVTVSVRGYPPPGLPPPVDVPPSAALAPGAPEESPEWTSKTLWDTDEALGSVWNTSHALEGPNGNGYFEMPICSMKFYRGCSVRSHPETQCIMPSEYCAAEIDPDTGLWADRTSPAAMVSADGVQSPLMHTSSTGTTSINTLALILGAALGAVVLCVVLVAAALLRFNRTQRGRRGGGGGGPHALEQSNAAKEEEAPVIMEHSTASFEDLQAFGIFFPRPDSATEASNSGVIAMPTRGKGSIDYLIDTGSFESMSNKTDDKSGGLALLSSGPEAARSHGKQAFRIANPTPPSRIPSIERAAPQPSKTLQDTHTSDEFGLVAAGLMNARRSPSTDSRPSLIPRRSDPGRVSPLPIKASFDSDIDEYRVPSSNFMDAADVVDLLASDNNIGIPRCHWSAYDTDTRSLSEVSILKSLRQIQHGYQGPNDGAEMRSDAWTKVELLEQVMEMSSRRQLLAGRYTLTGEVADGGQGLVFFGSMADPKNPSGRPLDVAIKFPLNRQGFMNEVLLSSLPHLKAHLPELIEVRNNTQGLHAPNRKQLPVFMVLPRGEPLDEFMQHNKPGALHCVLILMFLAEKLAAMHDAGLVHRDVKPANSIFLPLQHTWTLIDYGCAAQTGSESAIMMTPRYGAPELVRGIVENRKTIIVSPAVDVWSLGVMAFELLADNDSFAHMPAHEYWMSLEGRGLLPWEENMDGCLKMGSPFAKVIKAMLSRDPEDRPTMSEVVEGWKKAINMRAE